MKGLMTVTSVTMILLTFGLPSEKKSRIKVTDACQSLIGTFSTLRRCVVFGRMLQL